MWGGQSRWPRELWLEKLGGWHQHREAHEDRFRGAASSVVWECPVWNASRTPTCCLPAGAELSGGICIGAIQSHGMEVEPREVSVSEGSSGDRGPWD